MSEAGNSPTAMDDINALLTDDIGYVIRSPTTTRDDGAPSPSLLKDCRRVFALSEDERHLIAHKLLKSVQERLAAESSSSLSTTTTPTSANSTSAVSPQRRMGNGRRNQKVSDSSTALSAAATAKKKELREVQKILRKKKDYLDKLEVSGIEPPMVVCFVVPVLVFPCSWVFPEGCFSRSITSIHHLVSCSLASFVSSLHSTLQNDRRTHTHE